VERTIQVRGDCTDQDAIIAIQLEKDATKNIIAIAVIVGILEHHTADGTMEFLFNTEEFLDGSDEVVAHILIMRSNGCVHR
jgi:hypothetical protein